MPKGSRRLPPDYDDENHYCLRTYSTLRIFTAEQAPGIVTQQLAINPSRVWHRGSTETAVARRRNGWFLTSRGVVDSRDTRRHIDWLLQALVGQDVFLQGLREAGGSTNIICFWHAAGLTEGGPGLEPSQMAMLAKLGVTISWNIYFDT
jgi:hypothetical protein